MAVEFPGSEFPDEPTSKPITLFDIGFYVIALAASGFSGFTTYLGFSYDLPKVGSMAIALIIGLGLLLINFKIKEHKILGDGLAGPLVALLLFFVVSFISNTNAIYTYFLQNDIVADTQEQAWLVFDKETAKLLAAAENHSISIEGANKSDELTVERQNLFNQITDPANPGLGDLAQRHLQNIETILGIQITRLRAPSLGASLTDFRNYAQQLDDLISTQFDATRSDEIKIGEFVREVNDLKSLYSRQVEEGRYNAETTDLMKRDLLRLETNATTLIGFNDQLEKINNQADEIGSFQYTWRNFVNKINMSAIVLSVLLSVLLDLLTPALSLLLYKQDNSY